jgi:hypothetical protein
MTGRYLIYTPVDSVPNEKCFDSAWRRFAAVCRSLDRDGLDYEVQLKLADVRPHMLIMASGMPKPRRRPTRKHVLQSPPVPAQRCRDRALEAEWFLPENRGRRKDGAKYWGKHQARYQELVQMDEEHLRADAEYWREMEWLSSQRTGRADESTPEEPQEVAA